MRTCASVIANNAYVLYTNAAPEPSATSVSMLGALCKRPLNPLIKNFWLITIIIIVRSICISPIATWLPSRIDGSGQPHIICPIEIYISTIRNPTDVISLFFNTGVTLSFNISSCDAYIPCEPLFCDVPLLSDAVCDVFKDAPYPASSTAFITASSLAIPSTPIELVRRLTEQFSTPSTFDTAFSTRLLHAAQLIPVTIYCFIIKYHLPVFICFLVNKIIIMLS